MHCRGAACRSRHCTDEFVQAVSKTVKAKVWGVAALTERPVQGNSTAQGHWCTSRSPDVSLRGGQRPTWQSREGSYVFAGAFLLSTAVLRDCHVASLLAMTNLGVLRHKINITKIASLHGDQGAPLQTQSVGAFLSAACANCECLPEIATAPLGPRNDNSGVHTILTVAWAGRQCAAGRGMSFHEQYNRMICCFSAVCAAADGSFPVRRGIFFAFFRIFLTDSHFA